jgi:hypothetical protein
MVHTLRMPGLAIIGEFEGVAIRLMIVMQCYHKALLTKTRFN